MTDIIITIMKFVKSFVSFLVPDALFATDIITNFYKYLDFFLDIIVQVNFLIPVPTIFSCIAIIVTFKVVKFTLFISNWIVRAVLDVIL